MDNAVESILIVFAVIVFVIALSMTTYLLSTAMNTTEQLIYYSDKTNYLDNMKYTNQTSRNVGIDTVINSLYRYYKENFMVIIRDKIGKEVQVFDTSIEGKVYVAASKTAGLSDEENALMSKYGPLGGANLFGAPWMGNTNSFAKYRVDLYVSGQKGYINNQEVDYSGNGLDTLSTTNTFKETFIQYMYSGDIYTSMDESIIGNEKPKNKIIIEYQAQ